jgi:hypothetical protein
MDEGQAAFLNEALGAINARVAARQLELDTMEAQEALNTELIAQEEERLAGERAVDAAIKATIVDQQALTAATAEQGAVEEERVFAPRMRGLQILRNFISNDLVGAISVAIFAGLEAERLVEGYYEKQRKIEEEAIKTELAFVKQENTLLREVGAIDTVSQAESFRAKVNADLDALQEKRIGASEKDKDLIDQQVTSLTAILDMEHDRAATILQQEQEAEHFNQVLQDQKDAVDDLAHLNKLANEQDKAGLEVKLNALENEHRERDLAIETQQRAGALSPTQAAAAKGDEEIRYQTERGAAEQSARDAELKRLTAQRDDVDNREAALAQQGRALAIAADEAHQAAAENEDPTKSADLKKADEDAQKKLDEVTKATAELVKQFNTLNDQITSLNIESGAKGAELQSNLGYEQAKGAADISAAGAKEDKTEDKSELDQVRALGKRADSAASKGDDNSLNSAIQSMEKLLNSHSLHSEAALSLLQEFIPKAVAQDQTLQTHTRQINELHERVRHLNGGI